MKASELKRIRAFSKARMRPDPESPEAAEQRRTEAMKLLERLADEVLSGEGDTGKVAKKDLDALAAENPAIAVVVNLLLEQSERMRSMPSHSPDSRGLRIEGGRASFDRSGLSSPVDGNK